MTVRLVYDWTIERFTSKHFLAVAEAKKSDEVQFVANNAVYVSRRG